MADSYLDRLYQVAGPIYTQLLRRDTTGELDRVAQDAIRLAKILINEIEKERLPDKKLEAEIWKSQVAAKADAILHPTSFSSRNLLYHLTPMEDYKDNIKLLLKYWDVFTGKKVIAIAQGEWLENIEIVKRLFPRDDKNLEFIEVHNNKRLREGVSFPALLRKASRFPQDSITFYAHSKGVTRDKAPGVKLWTEAMHYYNLADISMVEDFLTRFPVFGVFKTLGVFPQFPKESKWHYSGTFFWFRNKDLFAKPRWAMVPRTRYGVEAYLSLLFNDIEAANPGPMFKGSNGYNEKYITNLLKDAGYPDLK